MKIYTRTMKRKNKLISQSEKEEFEWTGAS
jgi:hypothetical protein